MAQDLAHRKHPVQCLETARKRVASEHAGVAKTLDRAVFCMHGMQLKPVHMIIADSAKRTCPPPPPPPPPPPRPPRIFFGPTFDLENFPTSGVKGRVLTQSHTSRSLVPSKFAQGHIDPPKAGRGHATPVQPVQRAKCWRLLNLEPRFE